MNFCKTFLFTFFEPECFIFLSFCVGLPKLLKVLQKAFGKKLENKMKQFSLLESEDFKKYKRYMIYLFKKVS